MKDKYLKVLKYAYNHNSFTEKNMRAKITLSDDEFNRFVLQIICVHPKDNKKYVIRYNAFIDYLKYLELEQAKQSAEDAKKTANRAKWLAIISIIFAFITIGLSIFFSIKQLNAPMKIEKMQFETIQNLSFDPTVIEKKINDIIKKKSYKYMKKINLQINVYIEYKMILLNKKANVLI